LALAMLLRHSLDLHDEAGVIESVVADTLKSGHRTRDIAAGGSTVSTTEMGDLVVAQLA
ncbi:MAG: 3-isopropylmalate dehydrogenase, partial [Fuerstiella sp.]|nr:3-isopropylmalate dehydrogenase [Fuerstiella sp.]